MPHSDLVSYIREQTQQGVSAEALRESLLGAGWRELDIENALHDVAAGLHPATPGASIHEDLAQVRGMVAHLASRVNRIESKILPSVRKRGGARVKFFRTLVFLATTIGIGLTWYGWRTLNVMSPIVAALLSVFWLVFLVVFWYRLGRSR